MPRQPDTVRVSMTTRDGQTIGLSQFTSLQLTHDIAAPTEASFEIGDDGSWPDLEAVIKPGTKCSVFVNGSLRMTGRVEADDNPLDTSAGAVVRFTARTILSDAMYASADQDVKVKDTTIFEFLIALYEPFGGARLGFITDQKVLRDLITGKLSPPNDEPADLESLTAKDAVVRPPETIYAAADRHLRRHGLMHWDAPDGRIIVGRPNDALEPAFQFSMYRDRARARFNNVIGATRTIDWSGVPSDVTVYGRGGIRDYSSQKVQATRANADVIEAGFHRPVTILQESIRTRALAERAVARELSSRNRRKDEWSIEVDGLGYWDGFESVPYSNDVVCEVFSDVVGGPAGAYYIPHLVLQRSAQGDSTSLTLIRRGLWEL